MIRVHGGIRRLLTRNARAESGMTEEALRVRRKRQQGLGIRRSRVPDLEGRPLLVRRARQAGGRIRGRGRRKDRHGNDGVRPQRERGGDDVTRRRAQNVLVRLAGPRGFVDGNGRQPRPRRDCGIRPRREPRQEDRRERERLDVFVRRFRKGRFLGIARMNRNPRGVRQARQRRTDGGIGRHRNRRLFELVRFQCVRQDAFGHGIRPLTRWTAENRRRAPHFANRLRSRRKRRGFV